jgi:hypothetical protein
MMSKNKTLVCNCNDVYKTIQFERPQCWYYWRQGFMVYTVEMGLGAKIYVLNFMKIGSGIQKLSGGLHIQTDTQTAR